MKTLVRFFVRLLVSLMVLALTLYGVAWLINYHPKPIEARSILTTAEAPVLQPGQELKVLVWNVQYMAGKDYVFFYDVPDGSGPDERPTAESITQTLDEVARVIMEEDADIVLLQEVDEGADRTGRENQTQRLLQRLDGRYPVVTEAFYWKSAFVPHPRVMGSAGMKLTTLSQYAIRESRRHQLATLPVDPVSRLFQLKRCVLETTLPIEGGGELVVLNLHLEAFTHGSDIMEKQIAQVATMVEGYDEEGTLWMAGGDFNLLPPGAYELLPEELRVGNNPSSELSMMMPRWPSVPSREEVVGPDRADWFTHFSNNPAVTAPNKTIDYLFYSRAMERLEGRVRQDDTLAISDHLPVVARLRLPME